MARRPTSVGGPEPASATGAGSAGLEAHAGEWSCCWGRTSGRVPLLVRDPDGNSMVLSEAQLSWLMSPAGRAVLSEQGQALRPAPSRGRSDSDVRQMIARSWARQSPSSVSGHCESDDAVFIRNFL